MSTVHTSNKAALLPVKVFILLSCMVQNIV